jgi:hypothetical protein
MSANRIADGAGDTVADATILTSLGAPAAAPFEATNLTT